MGGGGYTVKNASRTWAYETACALGVEGTIDERLPWNEFFEWFAPRYRLEVAANNMEDYNLRDEEGSLKRVLFVPSSSGLVSSIDQISQS